MARGRMVLWADFIEAAGPLSHQQPPVLHALPAEAESTSYRQVGPVLDWEGYAALWCFLAARDHRITRAATLVEGIDPTKGMCALHDPDRGIAWIQMDGSVHVAGEPALLEESARRQAVSGFVDRYNSSWLIQRHGHLTPKEAYQAAQTAAAA